MNWFLLISTPSQSAIVCFFNRQPWIILLIFSEYKCKMFRWWNYCFCLSKLHMMDWSRKLPHPWLNFTILFRGELHFVLFVDQVQGNNIYIINKIELNMYLPSPHVRLKDHISSIFKFTFNQTHFTFLPHQSQ